jgi:hypothetical protein
MSDKYEILKEAILDWKQTAKEDLKEAQRVAGHNCYGAGFAAGEIQAYEQILSDIEELKSVAVITD